MKHLLAFLLICACIIAGAFADNSFSVTVAKTRPADTTAYTAGDVISESAASGTVWTFANIGPPGLGGKILITSIALRVDINAVPSGMSSFRLHLYSSTPTAINDNAAYDLASGDRASYLGYVTIPAPSDLGATLWAQDSTIRQMAKLETSSRALYGILETVGAYTPSSASVYTIQLQAIALAD